MDLLNENKYQEKKTPKGKKIVLMLLILSILLSIGILTYMAYLKSAQPAKAVILINGEATEITEDLVYDGKYIALKNLSEVLGYEYYNSEYQNYGIDTTKCYIKNKNLIYGFEQDSKKIYKYEENTDLDYQYYTLNNNIVMYNNKLYVAIEDLRLALNVYYEFDDKNNLNIYSVQKLIEANTEKLRENGYTITQTENNQKAMAYGWIIVEKNGLYGVLNNNLEEIIGTQYSSMYFDEYNKSYIVSNTSGKYGIISTTGSLVQSLKYDGLEILNYEHMLYKVMSNNKYGIMKSNGSMLTDIIFDEIGYKKDPNNKILYTLIVPRLSERIGETIVVKQNGKYGLIYLDTGKSFLDCDHLDKLYSISELGQTKYMIEAEKRTMTLNEYLEIRGTQRLNLN